MKGLQQRLKRGRLITWTTKEKKGLKIPLLWLNLVKQPIPVLLWNSCKRQEAVQSHQSHFYKASRSPGSCVWKTGQLRSGTNSRARKLAIKTEKFG
ncbi:mCG140110, partial [Mus musculus]